MRLMLLSDLSSMRGVKINAEAILIPKPYYPVMLQAYPETLKAVENFFAAHKTAKAVVIKEFEGR